MSKYKGMHFIAAAGAAVGLIGCASLFEADPNEIRSVKENREFQELVVIKTLAPPQPPSDISGSQNSELQSRTQSEPKDKSGVKPKKPSGQTPKIKPVKYDRVSKTQPAKLKDSVKGQSPHKSKDHGVTPSVSVPLKVDFQESKLEHLPPLEDSEGFNGRRPLLDPYAPGDVNELALTYLNMEAGTLAFETRPFVEVNGNKSYHFYLSIKSSQLFSMFYKLDNHAHTYVDYEKLIPYSHEVHINESKQIKEAKSFYDWELGRGKYWEKKVTDKGERSKNKEWELEEYSQNLISALFYIRAFQYEVGKTISFRVADAGKQVVFKGSVLSKEKVDVPAGTFETYKIKLDYETEGSFDKKGDVYFWMSADDKKWLVKTRAKIRIGSIVGVAQKIKAGS